MNSIFTAFEGDPTMTILTVLIMIFLALFTVPIIMSAAGFDWDKLLKQKIKADVDEVIIEKPISRKRERELLIEQCRETSQYSEHEVERKLNTMCLQILEDNPEICTMDELMIELDKIDKNLFKENLK